MTEYHHLDEIPGFLQGQEGRQLLEWARTWPCEGWVVEIGSFLGRSIAFLATGAKLHGDKGLLAVDHFQGSKEHQLGEPAEIIEVREGQNIFAKFLNNMHKLDLIGFVRPLVGNHKVAAQSFSQPIRLLFIDGEHDYESTKYNYDSWYPKVVPGGLIVFHDDDDAHPEVQKFVREIKLERIEAPKSLAAFVKV